MVDRRASRSGDPRTPSDDADARGMPVAASSYKPASKHHVLPTPDSLSPTLSKHSPPEPTRLPPSFEAAAAAAVPSRYIYTPQSPYRPGEYQRSECAPSERTRIERKLDFDDSEDRQQKDDPVSSSPLAPAFEAKMVLRNGSAVDLISWLRTNFHHQPPPHTPVTSFMSLVHVQRLLQERFPRVPAAIELKRAVLAAFPHSEWEEPSAESIAPPEPPLMRGLTWHGKDVADEDDEDLDATPGRSRSAVVKTPRAAVSAAAASAAAPPALNTNFGTSQSPTPSPLLSPESTSTTRRALPDTPARSVLDEFAEIVTRTPVMKERPLDTEPEAAGAYALANICNSTNRSWRKRPASQSPDRKQRRASTPDALQELLNAAEAIEGSPLNTMTKKERGHKRRRTIAGSTTQDFAAGNGLGFDPHRSRSVRGTASPQMAGLSLLAIRERGPRGASEDTDPVSPLASEESHASAQLAALGRWRGPASSTASQLSHISESVTPIAANPPPKAGRKINELPTSTQGHFPGVDCKPPYPYHEMIRHAIENAPDRKLQLAQIYSSIANRFPFFKTLDDKKTAGWQNSIRHNLSLKKMFVRVNKADGTDDGGKGGWWTVQPGVPDEGRPGRKAKAKRALTGKEDGGNDTPADMEGMSVVATPSSADTGTPVPPKPILVPVSVSASGDPFVE